MGILVGTRVAGSDHSASTGVSESFTIGTVSPAAFWILYHNNTLSSFTWNGVAPDTLVSVQNVVTNTNVSLALYRNPAQGTLNALPTFAGAVNYKIFLLTTTGGNTTTQNRTTYTQKDEGSGPAGPGLTVVDSQNGDLVMHGAHVNSSSITFDGGEDTTSTEVDNFVLDGTSIGVSTKAATGANTVVGCTDVAFYAEIAMALIPATSGPGSGTDSLPVQSSDVARPVTVTLSIQESG